MSDHTAVGSNLMHSGTCSSASVKEKRWIPDCIGLEIQISSCLLLNDTNVTKTAYQLCFLNLLRLNKIYNI